jgi:flagellar basal-body rod protein FlgG
MASIEFVSGLVGSSVGLEGWFEVISHNLSNLQTPGFKRHVLSFENEEFEKSETEKGFLIRPTKLTLDLSQGLLKPTGNPLDLAISGEGFFVVQTPRGERFTRKGDFSLDRNGFLVTNEGFQVLGEGGPIEIGRGREVVINERGEVTVDGEVIDTLRIVTFSKEARLIPEGNGLIRAEGGEVLPAEGFSVKQGFLEGSNVSPIEEMVRLMNLIRLFEAYQKALQTSFEDLSRKLIQEVIKV